MDFERAPDRQHALRPARIHLVRHGRTVMNRQVRFRGRRDVPLDEVGRLQAKGAAHVLRELEPAAIVSSDLARAWDTAQVLGAALDLPVTADPRLREIDVGRWAGRTAEEIVAAGDGEVLAGWRRGDDVPVGGAERPSELGRRGATALREHAETMSVGVLVVVAHGALIRASVLTLLGVEQDRWQGLGSLGNCAWGVLAPRRPWWRLLQWGLTAADEQGGTPAQPM
jgi:probable phosphoglycerate mutase